MENLLEKIKRKNLKSAVVGLGYVGLPLAIEMAKAGFEVIGIDINENRVKKINNGISYIPDVPSEEVKKFTKNKRFFATTSYKYLSGVDTINICVPTPLRKTKEPDISYIISAAEEIRKHMNRNKLIILESTTYPGTTEEIILPILESIGLKVGRDFWLVFSPERIDPGNKKYQTRDIPKVVGGVTKGCTKLAVEFYSKIVEKVIPVSSPQVAEMVKLLENTFRSVNIALVNELALMCKTMNIDVWEVITAASSKPFGFMPFYPGPGLGGHCIPIDPYYLTWKARLNGFHPKFIELASEINNSMPEYVVHIIQDALNFKKKSLNGSKILLLGVAYKKDVNDWRESPAIEVIKILKERGANVCYNDPYILEIMSSDKKMHSVTLTKNLISRMDCIVITTNHSCYDYKFINDNAQLIIDTRNSFRNSFNKKIVRL
jgi:UDP-N-acetyl-D-glucosamine dehydrogenase